MSNQSPGLWPDAEPVADKSPQVAEKVVTEDSSTAADKPAEMGTDADQPPAAQEAKSKAAKAPKKPKASAQQPASANQPGGPDQPGGADQPGSVEQPTPSTPKPAPEPAARPGSGNEKISKSRRIREFLDANPEARNRDVAAALEQYGVKAADVANVKALQKQRGGTTDRASASASSPVETKPVAAGKRGRKKAARKPSRSASAASQVSASKQTVSSSKPSGANEIGLTEVDAAIQFIEQAGGIDRARQIIDLVDRIRRMNIG